MIPHFLRNCSRTYMIWCVWMRQTVEPMRQNHRDKNISTVDILFPALAISRGILQNVPRVVPSRQKEFQSQVNRFKAQSNCFENALSWADDYTGGSLRYQKGYMQTGWKRCWRGVFRYGRELPVDQFLLDNSYVIPHVTCRSLELDS